MLHTGCVYAALLAGHACVEGVALSPGGIRDGSRSRVPGQEPGHLHFAVLPPTGQKGQTPGLMRANATMAGPVAVHNFHGNFGGGEAFLDAILKDLGNTTLGALQKCALGFRGQTDSAGTSDDIHVWIVVNAEDETGEQAWSSIRSWADPQDRVLILGPRWNEERGDDIVYEGRATGMYIPFASLNFAERHHHTPMDLYVRSNINFGRERQGELAYQQNNCAPNSYREAAFTALDSALRAAGHMPGSALSKCHGENPPGGYMNADGVNCDANCSNYDRSVGRYEEFRFVLAMEHGEHVLHYGYVTEKIVDAFLAGAVPISDSSAERAEVFNQDSYVAVDPATLEGRRAGTNAMLDLLRDPQEWDRMRRLPSVTADSLRKFFSWHPAVWKSHGDFLRQRIIGEVLKLCN